MSLAWHIEALSRQKRLPKLETLFSQKPEKRRQTLDEMIAATVRWDAAINRAQSRGNSPA